MTSVLDESEASSRHRTRPPSPNAVVLVLVLAGISAALMQTLVIPLLGDLPRLLDTSPGVASWVVTATLLTAAVATPVSGRLGDLYGKRRVMLGCTAALVTGSATCALSAGAAAMIVGRGLQGVGMGLVPLGIAAMRDLVPAERLGSSIAVMSAAMGIGGGLGLPAAAAVAEHGDWRMMFWASTALGLVVATLIAVVVPAAPVAARGRFDPIGALGLGTGLVCLLLAVSQGAEWGWRSAPTLGCLLAAVVVLLVWGAFELRSDHPLVDLRVTARPVVLLTNLAGLVLGFAMFAQSLVVPQLMQLPVATGYGLGQGMVAMGLWMLPGGLVMTAVSPWGARLSRATSPRITLAVGSTVIAAGYGVAVLLMGGTWGLALANCVASGGVGLAYGALPALIVGSVPLSETGSANSVNSLMRSIGTSVASAVMAAVLIGSTVDFGGRSIPSEGGFRLALLIGAGVAILAAAIALAIPVRASREAEERIEREVGDLDPAPDA